MKPIDKSENIPGMISFRPAEPCDGSRAVELLNAVYGNWGDLAQWQWKYLQQPVDYRLKSFIATREDGTAVGFFGANPVDVHYQGTIVRGGQTVDAAVLPVYRRQGIHTELGTRVLNAAAEDNVHFIYAFPGIYSLKVNQEIGYEAVMFTPEMWKVINPGMAASRWLHRLPKTLAAYWRWRYKRDRQPDTIADLAELRAWFLMGMSWVSSPTREQRGTDPRQRIQEVVQFRDDFDRIDEENQPRLGLVKNSRYLNWRYMQHPHHKYRCFAIFDRDAMSGYCVLRFDEDTAKICELECTPREPSSLLALLAEIKTLAKESGCSTLTIWQNSSSTKQAALRKMGFISPFKLHRIANKKPRLAAQLYQVIIYSIHLPQEARQALINCVEELALSMGDSDLV
jgi:GNAT superfamily N-acetyltransferase